MPVGRDVNCRNHLLLRLNSRKGAHMQIIIGVVCVLGAVGTIVFLSTLHMSGLVKVPILIMAVLIAVYSMARIQPKETKSEQDSEK
jgi:hypothetical protein